MLHRSTNTAAQVYSCVNQTYRAVIRSDFNNAKNDIILIYKILQTQKC